MENINILIKNIKNLFPYFFLISIYFFFINLEARKDTSKKNTEIENFNLDNTNSNLQNKLRITIPVVPYNE